MVSATLVSNGSEKNKICIFIYGKRMIKQMQQNISNW